jgi:hypothetical protein
MQKVMAARAAKVGPVEEATVAPSLYGKPGQPAKTDAVTLSEGVTGKRLRRGRYATTVEFSEYERSLLDACCEARGMSSVGVLREALRDYASRRGIKAGV